VVTVALPLVGLAGSAACPGPAATPGGRSPLSRPA